jgi:hypothetical protein
MYVYVYVYMYAHTGLLVQWKNHHLTWRGNSPRSKLLKLLQGADVCIYVSACVCTCVCMWLDEDMSCKVIHVRMCTTKSCAWHCSPVCRRYICYVVALILMLAYSTDGNSCILSRFFSFILTTNKFLMQAWFKNCTYPKVIHVHTCIMHNTCILANQVYGIFYSRRDSKAMYRKAMYRKAMYRKAMYRKAMYRKAMYRKTMCVYVCAKPTSLHISKLCM